VAEGPLHYGQPYFLAARVPASAPAQIAPVHARQGEWDAGEGAIQLVGYDSDSASCQPGGQISLTFYWRTTATARLPVDYTVFVHLLGSTNPATGGPIWAQDDSEPCREGYPTSAWSADEIVLDDHTLAVPDSVPAGEYEIAVGLYDWRTMVRLPVVDADGQVIGDHVILGSLRIEAAP
jgi:hypothetical protein